jgi:hypothetical protein
MVLSEYFPTLDPKDTGNAVFQNSVCCHLKSAAVSEGEGSKIFETSGNTYPVTQRFIPEDPNV